jgi:hypothetical protein
MILSDEAFHERLIDCRIVATHMTDSTGPFGPLELSTNFATLFQIHGL